MCVCIYLRVQAIEREKKKLFYVYGVHNKTLDLRLKEFIKSIEQN